MSEIENKTEITAGPVIRVSPSPHSYTRSLSTKKMMLDVILALVPLMGVAVWVFGMYAVKQIILSVLSCVVAEGVFTMMRGRGVKNILDGSAVITGIILAMSIPWSCPWYVTVIGGVMAIGLGKVVFGGIGQNIFNPAMVGRAFIMICFAGAIGASAYVANEGAAILQGAPQRVIDVVSQATPMTVIQKGVEVPSLMGLFLGNVNGSLGETSALAALIGGFYLCMRRTAAWQIPAGAIVALAVISGLIDVFGSSQVNTLHQIFGGAFLFGAFYIMTDPVSSPITPKGRWICGILFGATVMLLRTMSNYPEGTMFAVLLVNAIVPLINRWTIPTPVGGPVPVRK